MRSIVPLALAFVVLSGPAGAAPLQQAAAGVTESAGYHFLVARHLEDTGRIEEAIAALNKALELEPGSAEIRAELASIYARQNRAVEAIETAEAALKFDPDNRAANRLLGSIYSALADQKRPIRAGDDPAQYAARAIAALERARRPSLADPGLDFTLGRLYLREGQNEKAIEALERVFTQQPEYSEGGLLLAAAQEAAGRVDAAIGTLEETIKHNPGFFRGYVQLIELYEGQQRWKEAAGAYARAAEVNPRANLTEGWAAALLNSGAPSDALALLERAIARTKTPDAALLYLLAESQRQLKQLEAAEATVARLRREYPDDPRGVLMTAQLQLAQGRRSEAVGTFADLMKRFPNQPTLAYQYAQLLDEADRPDEAEKVLRDVLAKNPLDAIALNSLGYMFAERGVRLDEAVQLLQRALKIEPGNPSYLDSLGWAYFKQGNLEQADGPLTEAAEKLPENSVIQDHLGDLRYRQGRLSEAIEAWERALKGDGESIDRSVIEKKLREARTRGAKQ